MGWDVEALDEAQSALFRYPRPAEELYDTAADPYEIQLANRTNPRK